MRISLERVGVKRTFKGNSFPPNNTQRVIVEPKEEKRRSVFSDFILISGIVLGIAGVLGNFVVPRGV